MKPTNPSLEMSTNCSKDRISDLPDDVIQRILSFGTVKDAVKFCSLSRHWKFLWTSIPNLLFHCECRQNVYDFDKRRQNVRDFASFVDKALMLYSAPKVKTFWLDFEFSYELKDQVDSWLLFALTHDVEELFLIFRSPCSEILDEWSWSWAWPSLKVLSLVNLRLAMKEIRSIFCGSTLIECLTLRRCILICEGDCYMIDVTDIGLKILTLDSCHIEFEFHGKYLVSSDGHVEIKGLNLLSLNVVGNMLSTGLKLDDLPSLIEANVCFTMTRSSAEEEKKMIMDILEKLHHVNRLVVGAIFFQVLSSMRLDGEICPTFTCKSLKINLWITKKYLHRLEVLLHSFPCLRQLILNVGTSEYHNLYRKKHALEEKYWRSKTGSLECLNQNLEKAEIIGHALNPKWYQSRNLVKVAQFLLDNAKVLQKLTIYAQVYDMCRPLDPIEPKKLKKLLEIKKNVLHYPRASPNAVVVFETGRE